MYLHLVDVLRDQCMWIYLAQHFRYLKWRNPHLYKLYGYGLCEGKPTPKIAENKVQYLHFRYLELLVNTSPIDPSTGTQAEQRCQQREIWGLVSRVWSSSHWCQVGLGMRSVIGKMLGKPLGIFHTILAKDQPSKPTNQPTQQDNPTDPTRSQVVATQTCFIFTPILGEMESNLTSIFFRWVGSTTN